MPLPYTSQIRQTSFTDNEGTFVYDEATAIDWLAVRGLDEQDMTCLCKLLGFVHGDEAYDFYHDD